MARDRPGWASRAERFRAHHTAFAAGARRAASSRGNAGRAIPPPAPALHRWSTPARTRPVAHPAVRRKVVSMIREINVDGEDALEVDTAEELGSALMSGLWVRAPQKAHEEHGLPTGEENTDAPQDVRRRVRLGRIRGRAALGRLLNGLGRQQEVRRAEVEPGRVSQGVCQPDPRADQGGGCAVAETVEAGRDATPDERRQREGVPRRELCST